MNLRSVRPLTPHVRGRAADRNRVRLLASAAEVTNHVGWDALTYAAVAQQAGLSSRPLVTRFPHKTDLAIDLWNTYAAPPLAEQLLALIDLLVTPPGSTSSASETERDLVAAVAVFTRPTPELIVAIELLSATDVDRVLRDHLAAWMHDTVGARCLTPQRGNRTVAAQSSFVVIAALGLLLSSRRPPLMSVDISPHVRALAAALRQPALPRRLPMVSVEHMEATLVATGDAPLDALLNATTAMVSSVGYHAASTARIAEAAGVSEGLMYGRYNSKLDLFIDATERGHVRNFDVNRDLQLGLEARYDAGIAEAVMLREFLRPTHSLERVLAIERLRLAWHEPRMRASALRAESEFLKRITAESSGGDPVVASSHLFWDLSLGNGASLVPFVLPAVWKLPFDVVTTPLFVT